MLNRHKVITRKLLSKGEGQWLHSLVGRPVGPATGHGLCAVILKLPFAMPRARTFVTSVFFTGGPSNPCDDCVAMRDWTTLLLLGSNGVVALHFSQKPALKILQGYVEFGDLLAI